jgi:hypothetical protein
MQRKPEFLQFKAHQIASASFVLALNLATSDQATKLSLVHLSTGSIGGKELTDPLMYWSEPVSKLSGIS